jgi:hypothetical protein
MRVILDYSSLSASKSSGLPIPVPSAIFADSQVVVEDIWAQSRQEKLLSERASQILRLKDVIRAIKFRRTR